MMTHIVAQEKTFYEELQTCKGLDLRDNRGKSHDLAYILLGLTLSLLSNRDGNLSSIHRSMKNKNESLCLFLGVGYQGVISHSHLPVVLQKVNVTAFEDLLFSYYGMVLTHCEKVWFSGDGKELQGSILEGEKRGEALVQIVSHQQLTTVCQSRYNGTKESDCFFAECFGYRLFKNVENDSWRPYTDGITEIQCAENGWNGTVAASPSTVGGVSSVVGCACSCYLWTFGGRTIIKCYLPYK